jgi:uncharacterized OB-fold protein
MTDRPEYAKPLPTPTKEDAPFWEAMAEHQFLLPRCRECGHVWFPPYLNCQQCLSLDREWFEASGRGRISGFTVIDHPYLPSFLEDLPYTVVLVQLAEGPMMYSNLVDTPHESVQVGMDVELVFDDVAESVTLPKFRIPVGTG